ncbi:PREDICTED: 26S proteasome non-ATPase regulatory subunit 8 isoform X1 [Ceratosolen solmsi marchali]|uniref:26S proteasome non-ATPase regulatory subunit 8 n=1 Tax=Ceratosolen solmsi marchali TaxID=326594 RepID=A0AAJ6YCJ5_9HYME|nr:PREDICTED: 26S proteasome non-ATPase regulatory subunit 8 isoform X1 [Ceratosolen solmsi marchali]
MAALKDVVSKAQVLKQEWSKTPCNLIKCGELLNQLKIALTNLTFLPTKDTASEKELIIARDVLEIGAQWSIASEDIPSFERYMAQLKCYYFDYKSSLPESAYKYQLLGLNLLFLLSQNRVAEFHTELELLPVDCIQSNIYIRHPLSLEQCLMEGSYNKIFLAKGNVPAASYNFFIDILLNTVRDEIGACMESAFDKISIKDAARMLNLSTEKETMQFCNKKKWTVAKDGYFHFGAPSEKKVEEPIPSTELVTLAIDYARELEMIV